MSFYPEPVEGLLLQAYQALTCPAECVTKQGMKITPEEVRYVAKLARLSLSEAEVEKTTLQLDTILSYVEKLGELDTTSVLPTTHALDIRNAFREDLTRKSLPQQEALANGPLQNGEAFVVPRVI